MTAHPARFSDQLMPALQELVDERRARIGRNPTVLDPFAGTGRIHELERCITYGIEIEPEWAGMHERTALGDATDLPWQTASMDMVVTSPTYGNRMADHHEAKDGSERITYRHKLGRPLSENNSGQMQWGQAYRELHLKAWLEAKRVLRPGGVLVINCRDHYRKDELIHVTDWHRVACETIGFVLAGGSYIKTPGMRFGANGGKRVDGEHLLIFTNPTTGSET